MVQFKNIVKIKSGLVEKVNPLLKSKLSDFLGTGVFTRDKDTNIFTVHNGYIEKNFNMKQFILVIGKENKELEENSKYGTYVRIGGSRSGLVEYYDEETKDKKTSTHYKIIYYDNYIQTYLSYDNMETWIATGGGQNKKVTDTFGFFVEGNNDLIINDFKIFDSPYVQFLNIPNDYLIKIYDNNNKLIIKKKSSYGKVEMYLHKPIYDGYFIIYDRNETEKYRSEKLDINLGDIFDDSEYELEVYYLNELLDRYTTTKLVNPKLSILYVKNKSSHNYTNINIQAIPNVTNIDNIELSLDNISFNNKIQIPILNSQDTIEIFVKVNKDLQSSNFGLKFFDIIFS